jgi:site-specific DNA-cytosine methylase
MYDKLASGGNIMRKNTEIPKDYIGAFVGHMPTSLTHPDEDRYLTIRECLSIMKMPTDFQLKGGLSNLNHICQNVPVTTAMDMAAEVKSFVEGRSDNRLIETDFLMQDNKTQTYEYEKNGLHLDEFMV